MLSLNARRQSVEGRLDALADAVENGHLSLIDALRVASKGSVRLTSWLRKNVDHFDRTPSRRPQRLSQLTPPPEVIARAVKSIRQRIGRRREVVSVHWGALFKKGLATGDAGVVVTVRTKRSRRALTPRAMLPRSLTIVQARRRYVIRLDIQPTRGPGVLHAGALQVRPGDFASVKVSGGDVGTLSAILNGASPVAVLSGHVGVKQGLSVTATTEGGETVSLGTIRKVVTTALVDGATASPVSPSVVDALVSQAVAVRTADDSLVSEKVFLLLRGDFNPTPSWVSDVHADTDFWYGNTTKTMKDLIALSPQCTAAGDSGAPVIDFNKQLIGFVLGAQAGKTFVLPAERVLNACNQ